MAGMYHIKQFVDLDMGPSLLRLDTHVHDIHLGMKKNRKYELEGYLDDIIHLYLFVWYWVPYEVLSSG